MNLPQRKGAILRIKNVLHSFYRNFIGEFKLCSTRLRKARNVLNPTQLKEREKKKQWRQEATNQLRVTMLEALFNPIRIPETILCMFFFFLFLFCFVFQVSCDHKVKPWIQLQTFHLSGVLFYIRQIIALESITAFRFSRTSREC